LRDRDGGDGASEPTDRRAHRRPRRAVNRRPRRAVIRWCETSMRLTPMWAVAVVALSASAATAPRPRFWGAHPIVKRYGGGYCYIEAAHLHRYAPDHVAFYYPTAFGVRFIGDPTPFGYEGERHIFYGHHPIHIDTGEPLFCFIDGPHQHPYRPSGSDEYTVRDGVAFYMGSLS